MKIIVAKQAISQKCFNYFNNLGQMPSFSVLNSWHTYAQCTVPFEQRFKMDASVPEIMVIFH